MSLPAVLLHTREAGSWNIAGLSLLERLIVAAHRAGFHPIQVVATATLPRFRRLSALGIAWEPGDAARPLPQRGLVAASHALVTVDDLKKLRASADTTQGSSGLALESATGARLPIALLNTGSVPAQVAWEALPSLRGGAVCRPITDGADRKVASRNLWRSLRSSSDGWVDRHFNRPVGRWLSKLLVHTPVSPNQVSVLSIGIGILSGVWFARGDPGAAIVASLLLQVSAIIDCVDGELARVLFKESRWGRWLDLVGDQFVHIAVFVGIPLGLYRQGIAAPWLLLGASCVLGVGLSFAAVLRGLSRPASTRSDQVERLVDATTNRDFSVLLIGLAFAEALEWFVWTAAFAIHLFWIAVVTLQIRDDNRARKVQRSSTS